MFAPWSSLSFSFFLGSLHFWVSSLAPFFFLVLCLLLTFDPSYISLFRLFFPLNPCYLFPPFSAALSSRFLRWYNFFFRVYSSNLWVCFLRTSNACYSCSSVVPKLCIRSSPLLPTASFVLMAPNRLFPSYTSYDIIACSVHCYMAYILQKKALPSSPKSPWFPVWRPLV